ncbi:hypothetical protein L7F22_001987 [Adiantum nelumboides]|nr:hypothetical protein [Adiantum nelumboides]
MSSASEHASGFDLMDNNLEQSQQAVSKRKRNLPGTPDPDAEVIALSPRTLMATNRFVCEVCGKGFQRDQNLQLHRRGHNLPWKLKQREEQEVKKRVYVCPEVSCVHHDPSRALGDLTGIKKHFFRKHGDKKWKCEKCFKRYAVQSDWKAHQKVCGTHEYRCDCGTLFSRRDSFITHRAFCDALAEETVRVSGNLSVENEECSEHDQRRVARALASGMEAASSSLSHFESGVLDTPVTSTSSTRECSRLRSVLEQGGIESLSLNHESELKAYRPGKGPALSLCLGTGPGPGPPGVSIQTIQCFPHADNRLSTTKEDSVILSGFDEAMHWPSSSSGLGTYASMLESSNPDSSMVSATNPWLRDSLVGELASNSVAEISAGNHSFKNSGLSQFAPSAGIMSTLSFVGNGYLPTRPSSYQPPRHPGTAQLPATALLQKAALMGATLSTSSSLFHGFGGDSRPVASKEAQREPFLGFNSDLLSSNWPISSNENQSFEGHATRDYGHRNNERAEGSPYPALYSGQGTVQEFLNSSCNGGASVFNASACDLWSEVSSSLERDNEDYHLMGPSNPFLKGSMCQVEGSTPGSTLARLGSSTQSEKFDGGRTTLDFLGIGGRARTAIGMARTLSQREIASITTLNAGIKDGESATTSKPNLAG